MKSDIGVIDGSVIWPKLRSVLSQFSSLFSRYASRVFKALSKFVICLQIGRMESVLSALSDEQLDEIGVKRSGITSRAKFLITGTYEDQPA